MSASSVVTPAGCVQHTTNGGVDTFRYELWVPLAAAVGGLAAAPVGWLIRRFSQRFGWGLLILGPVAVFPVAPSLWRDQVTVGSIRGPASGA